MPLNPKEEFEFYYGEVDFDALQREQQKFKYLDNFLFETKSKDSAASAYRLNMLRLLRAHIDNKINLNADLDYRSLGELDLVEFLNRYEKMMDENHKQGPDKDKERLPFEGKKMSYYIKALKGCTDVYNKPLHEIWADKMMNGQLPLDKIDEVVAGHVEEINSHLDAMRNMPEQFAGAHMNQHSAEKASDALANIHMVRLAMEKAWKDRGVLWRIFHPVQAVQQYLYKNELAETEASFVARGVSFDKVMEENPDFSTSMMKSVYETSNVSIQKLKDEANKKKEEQLSNTEAKDEIVNESNRIKMNSTELDKAVNGNEIEAKSSQIEEKKQDVPNLEITN